MCDRDRMSRRDFLGAGAAAAALAGVPTGAPAILGGESPARTIGVGCIGLGTRGGDLINEVVGIPGVRIVAICDVYKPHLKKGVERSRNPEVRTYVDYHDLLADKAVDAVVIATPDHWHSPMVIDAAAAKKDVYCEKGWTRTIEEAKSMLAAVKRSAIVHQLGHQAREAACGVQAMRLFDEGLLGPVTLVRTGRFGNTPRGQNIWRWYGYYSAWERPDPAQVVKDLDWERWLGPAPRIPFSMEHFWHWRCYWNYGTGQSGDLLTHELDFVQSIFRHGIPDTCVCVGLNAFLKDGREVPDTWNALYHFEKHDRTVTFDASMNSSSLSQPVELRGKDASLRFNDIAHNANTFKVLPEPACRQPERLPKAFDPSLAPPPPTHMQDFFNCVRSRAKPKCDEDQAFIETVTAIMSVVAYKEKRQVRWDPVRQAIV